MQVVRSKSPNIQTPTNASSKPGNQRDSIANVFHQRIKVLYAKAAYPQTGNWAWITVKWIADGVSVRSLTVVEAQFFRCHVWVCSTIFVRFDVGAISAKQMTTQHPPSTIAPTTNMFFPAVYLRRTSIHIRHGVWMDLRDSSGKSQDANGKMCMSHYVPFFMHRSLDHFWSTATYERLTHVLKWACKWLFHCQFILFHSDLVTVSLCFGV